MFLEYKMYLSLVIHKILIKQFLAVVILDKMLISTITLNTSIDLGYHLGQYCYPLVDIMSYSITQ